MHFFLLDLTATEIFDVKNLQSQIDLSLLIQIWIQILDDEIRLIGI